MTRMDFGTVMDDGRYICDGCNVREPFEHRCHHGDGAWADGRSCQCTECCSASTAITGAAVLLGQLETGETT